MAAATVTAPLTAGAAPSPAGGRRARALAGRGRARPTTNSGLVQERLARSVGAAGRWHLRGEVLGVGTCHWGSQPAGRGRGAADHGCAKPLAAGANAWWTR